ncbi:MAG: hypothetical protein U0U70_15790 [Chitinophagaceae bacterium]
MATTKKKNKKKPADTATSPPEQDKNSVVTSDPQEEMQGPVSTLVQGVKHKMEENNAQTKEEADKIKDENT